MKTLLVLLLSWPGAALADAIPGQFVPDPGRPGWRGGPPPDPRIWEVPPRAYDSPVGPSVSAPAAGLGGWRGAPAGFILPVATWRGAPAGWAPPPTSLSAWRGSGGGDGAPTPPGGPPVPPGPPSDVPDGPMPPPPKWDPPDDLPDVPTPALAPGLAVTLFYARRLRRRIRPHA
jgi:hypothetical protein